MMNNEQQTTPISAPVDSFQGRVQPWMMACFGAEISADGAERNHRLLEESLELVQACGCTASEAHQLVEYVYGRPSGERAQEVGGVMVTLAALCLAQGLDMQAAGETELARIWTKVEAIRAKQAAKPKHSPLPAAVPKVVADDGLVPLSVDGKSVWLEGIGAVALDYSSVKSLSDIQDAAAPAQGDAAITDTSLVDLCELMNAASISTIPILLSAQSAGALVKAMTTSAPAQAHHSDDIAVDRCAAAMKHKLAASRAKGRGGWDDPEQCSIASLSELLRVHVDKGDPLDVANIAMMIQQRGGSISALMQAQEPVAYTAGSHDIFDLIREWAHLPEGCRYEAARTIIGYINSTYTAGVNDGKFLSTTSAPVQTVAVPDGDPVAWMRKRDITELVCCEPEDDGWTPLFAATAAQPSPVAVPDDPRPLFDRKLADLQQRGYEVIGRILHKDGVYAIFDSSCRWLTSEQYRRLMHEQNGSLFDAQAAHGDAEPEALLYAALNTQGRIVYSHESFENVDMNRRYIKTPTTIVGLAPIAAKAAS